ncbi:hypothetical protein [Ruminococcus albus]|uniref:Uncharacterized protein n=1 Tax=Ruminococcus albus TaxID=1264 RepID=A0A1I1Q3P5_RUMAL|nr:hypothetical protein [Ruminococcus albus]SFD14488.1 hypothetical protein SAMN02910406_03217 [Ruminococcus albus]
MVIMKEQLIGMGEDTAVCRMEFAVDSAAEIPYLGASIPRTIAPGSTVWDISTGEFYGMNSQGVWINQSTGEAVPEPEDS